MARGHQKEQARQKAQKEAAKRSKNGSQFAARAAGLQMKCPTCMQPLSNYKVLISHMEAKHPKENIPTEDSFK
ncbi:putative zinc finger protein [Hesseltinella vesiculosa]|uniref:Putative zinc finger protein n=1 Tax=Hesseltinella vesiculosa TaxID=101127 RepID=A0A1X2GRQ7_9FUNG|nr:putative zinc finger protein [Hesseltinella vesiculosa]